MLHPKISLALLLLSGSLAACGGPEGLEADPEALSMSATRRAPYFTRTTSFSFMTETFYQVYGTGFVPNRWVEIEIWSRRWDGSVDGISATSWAQTDSSGQVWAVFSKDPAEDCELTIWARGHETDAYGNYGAYGPWSAAHEFDTVCLR